MKRNADVDTLSKEQHSALYILTKYRHDLHTNTDHFFGSDTIEAKKAVTFLTGPMKIMLRSAGLPSLDVDQFLVMPDEDYAKSLGLTGEYLDMAKSTCRLQIEKLNAAIESYLKGIDSTYGTWYAPSGKWRCKSA